MTNTKESTHNIKAFSRDCSKIFVKDPLFMFFCPQKSNRSQFIEKYFLYHLPKWEQNGELINISSKNAIGALVDTDNFERKFSGKNSFSLKYGKYSANILLHREVVENIVNIVVPSQMKKRVLTIFAGPEVTAEEITQIIDICKKKAKEDNFVLIYETFSKRFIPLFEESGFETGYGRQYLNTQFFQTVMTYNI